MVRLRITADFLLLLFVNRKLRMEKLNFNLHFFYSVDGSVPFLFVWPLSHVHPGDLTAT
jgi:hypothetical protein